MNTNSTIAEPRSRPPAASSARSRLTAPPPPHDRRRPTAADSRGWRTGWAPRRCSGPRPASGRCRRPAGPRYSSTPRPSAPTWPARPLPASAPPRPRRARRRWPRTERPPGRWPPRRWADARRPPPAAPPAGAPRRAPRPARNRPPRCPAPGHRPGSAAQGALVTEVSAFDTAATIAARNGTRMASTSAAVMTLIIPHPGTSPRSASPSSSRSRSRATIDDSSVSAYAYARIRRPPVCSSPASLRQRDDADQPREQGEHDGDRQHEKHDRHHHGDLLAATGLQQPALTGLPDVGGLGAEHLGERRAALDRTRQGEHPAM